MEFQKATVVVLTEQEARFILQYLRAFSTDEEKAVGLSEEERAQACDMIDVLAIGFQE